MNRIGMCSECFEPTSVEEPCCNAPVWFEGALESIDEAASYEINETPINVQ